MFIETSAKAGYNVKQLFRRIAGALPGIIKDDPVEPRKSIQSSFPNQTFDFPANVVTMDPIRQRQIVTDEGSCWC